MTRNEFSGWCAAGVRLLDGATGTNMAKVGLPRGVCTEAWIAEHPEPLLQLQRAYVEAGSQIIYAPTFGANRDSLARFGLEGELAALNRTLVELSKQAANGRAMVAGDLTTTGKSVADDPADYEARIALYREQALALADAGVELFAVETMMGVSETMAAVEAIRSVSDLPVLCTLSLQSDGKAYFDGSGEEAAAAVEALGADAVGVNCSAGPDQLESVVAMMRRACALPIVAKPNAGLPVIDDKTGEAHYSMDETAFARHMAKLHQAGATILGGCCGTTPAYIRALRTVFPK